MGGRVADEDVSGQAGNGVAGVGSDTAGCGVGSGVGGGGGVAERNRANRCAGLLNVLMSLGDAGERVALHDFQWHHGKDDGAAVGAVKMPTECIERAAELAGSGDRGKIACARIVAEVETGEVESSVGVAFRVDLFSIETVAEVDVVVEVVSWTRNLKLVVARFVAAE